MTPQQIMLMIYIMYGFIALETLMIVFIFWKTPAMTFLKASMFKQPLMYVIGKDHLGFFRTFKPQSGTAYIKGIGLFNLTENSHTLEGGSKIPLYFAFRDLAATLTPDYPAIIQEIREQGFLVNNLEDIEDYIMKIRAGTLANPKIEIKPYKTYKFHDLANMFPFNLDPTFIDSTVQCEVAKFIKTMKFGQLAIGTIVVMIIVGAIAIFILNMAFKGKIDTSACQNMIVAACNSAPEAAKALVNAAPLK